MTGPDPPGPAAEAAAAQPPDLPAAGATGNLPALLTTLVGREHEIAEVAGLLRRHRLVTVTGPPGVGKTRVALAAAAQAAGGFRDGVWLVELAPLADPAGLVAAVLVALPLRTPAGGPAPDAGAGPGAGDRLAEVLAGRQVLLLLDTCEHLLAGCRRLVGLLLEGCPGVTVLATSREPLGADGEAFYRVAPLSLPGDNDVDTLAIGAAEAVRLFVARGAAAHPGFDLDARVAPSVAEICRRLDGLPLALEMAAARLSVLSVGEVADRMDSRFQLLQSRVNEPRHQTLATAIEWSHKLLSRTEVDLFRRLAVFTGHFGLSACEDICSGGPVAPDEVAGLLEALVAKSLVVADRLGSGGRYRMLESVRLFAHVKLRNSKDVDRRPPRHLAWFSARAAAADAERRVGPSGVWLDRLDQDRPNLVAALAWARSQGQVADVLRLSVALTWWWQATGRAREGLGWLDWALAQATPDAQPAVAAGAEPGAGPAPDSGDAPDADDATRTHAPGDAAGAPYFQAAHAAIGPSSPVAVEPGDARSPVDPALLADGRLARDALAWALRPPLPTTGLPATGLSAAGPLATGLPSPEPGGPGDAATVRRLWEQLAALRAGGDADHLAHVLLTGGHALFVAGDTPGARRLFEECLALAGGLVEASCVCGAWLGLGKVEVAEGDPVSAEHHFLEALRECRRVRDTEPYSAALCWLGEAARLRGDHGSARARLDDALALVAGAGLPLSVARARQFLGRLELSAGHPAAAAEAFEASLAPAAAQVPYHRLRSLLGLGHARLALGDVEGAAAGFDRALGGARHHHDPQAAARALAGLSGVAAAAGDDPRARRLRREALAAQAACRDLAAVLESLDALAADAAGRNHHPVAVRLLAAAGELRHAHRLARPAPIEEALAALAARLAGLLGPPAFEVIWAVGAQMTAAEAVSYALGAASRNGQPATGWDRLTPAERAVLALVGEGLTNREIAEQLFLSKPTVATHIGHIYQKTGLGSRRELRLAAREHADRPAADACTPRAIRDRPPRGELCSTPPAR